MSGPDIFISYCKQDRASARLFAESFAEEGFNVWWDAVLHSGETFDEVIERQLRASKAVVVLWSPRSVSSRWVRAEATQADRANKLVPVKIEACDLPIIFELTHTADLTDWVGDRADARWQSFMLDLRRHVGPAGDKIPAQAKPAKPALAEPAPAEPPRPAVHSGANGKSRRPSQEEIIQALERLGKPAASPLAEPTAEERAAAEFFKRADEQRRTEAERLHCLRQIHAPDSQAVHVIGPAGARIGRKAPADIIVPDPGVSREHCLVEFAADKLRVTDLNSTNGTFIDDQRIERTAILNVGSVLRVGNVAFEHEVRSSADMTQSGSAILAGERQREPRVARPS